MEVEDIKTRRDELGRQLIQLLDSFEEETGVRITSISYDRHWVGDGSLPSSRDCQAHVTDKECYCYEIDIIRKAMEDES